MNNIREKLLRVSQLADGGELERDLALGLLREVYEELKFGGNDDGAVSQTDAAPEVRPQRPDDDLARTLQSTEQSEPYIESEHVVFQVEDIEPEPEPEFDPAPVFTEPEPEPEPQFVPRQPVKPEVIRSLYGDGSTSSPTGQMPVRPEPVRPEPQFEQRATLGDSLRPETRDVASAAAAAATPIGISLRKSIGLNDRFVMIRDMFRGDTGAFDRTIDRLDGFASLEEAVMWLHDNFSLNPDSEGVMLLMNLLERRFS